MKIVVFKYGEALYREDRIFADRESEEKIPMAFCFYLIQNGEKNILVDTGCQGKERYEMYAYKAPVRLLKEYGLEADDITDVIITHSHFDHIAEIGKFKKAKVYIQRGEYERGAEYICGLENIVVFDEEYSVSDDLKIEKYAGHTSGSCIVFAKDNVLCGDECYFKENFEREVRIGNSFSPKRSEMFVKKYKNSKYNALLFHDPSILSGKVGFECVYDMD